MEQALAMLVLLGFAVWGLALVRGREERALLHRERQTEARASIARAAYTPAYPMLHTLNVHHAAPQAPPAPLPLPADIPVPDLPGLTTLDTLLGAGWRPAPDRILLGLGPGGARYEVPADDKLCHVLTVGRTGYGKSSFNRLLLPQLIACGFDVYLLDLDYAPVDPRNGEEWWPIAQRTAPGDALYTLADIRGAIQDARAEVDRRHVQRREGHGAAVPWTRRFYAVEEAPELVSQYPAFMEDVAHVLRRGRRVDVYLLLLTQSGLIKVLGGNSGDRDMFGTIAYVGGAPSSARAVLVEKIAEPEGLGLARLRCYGVPTSVAARIPYGTNSGIRALLSETARNGGETGRNGETANVIEGRFAPMPTPAPPVSPVSAPPETDPETAKRAAVRAALLTEESYGAIICRIWQVKPGGSDGYIRACAEMRAIVADLARGGA